MSGTSLKKSVVLRPAIFLDSCAAGHITENMPDANSADDLTEPNYRQIVAENIAIVFSEPHSVRHA